MAWYLDTSAAVKLVQAEAESVALHAWVTAPGRVIAASVLLRNELLRAVGRGAPERLGAARDLLDRVFAIEVGRDVCERAALLPPEVLRSLDALHLASAMALAEDLEGIVTYDARMRDGAERLGLTVLAPR